MELVLGYAVKVCDAHDLDPIVEKLTREIVETFQFHAKETAFETLLELFANTIIFHDFGKVNEFFQTDRMNNDDPQFKNPPKELFKPRHGHSDLGAFIYTVYFLEKVNTLLIPEQDKVRLSALALWFANSILLHHSPKLHQPSGRFKASRFAELLNPLEKYLDLYSGMPKPDISSFYLKNLDLLFGELESAPPSFPLFALLRLNFSLLTSADYLATGAYSYDLSIDGPDQWGILTENRIRKILKAVRTTKTYNADAYRMFEDPDNQFETPREPSEKNLNILRTEMAVKVLQQLRLNKDKRLYLEAPTGGGKTNLSMIAVAEMLRANPELKKVFYVFPFTTLITQTHQNIKETLGLQDDEIALMHSKTGFQTYQDSLKNINREETEDGLYGHLRQDFLTNLFALYPFMLITHIRFFDILKSSRKDSVYLMHRLANSIVVIDELQSYNPRQWDKMMYLIDQYSRAFNIHFILMSATLPRLDKITTVRQISPEMPSAEDLLPNARSYFINPNFRDRVRFNFDLLETHQETDESRLASFVVQKSQERCEREDADGRVFTIVEFIYKKTATDFKGEIEKLGSFFDRIFVLSGTILENRRREIIHFLKRNRKSKGLKVLLITTQVVEAGVDIDMDLGFKNVSLIDSDEQLAGRVNRNVSKTGCEVYLFRLNEPNVLYGKDFRFKITKEELPPDFHRTILETKDFMQLYDRVFNHIDQRNRSELFENFRDNYHRLFSKADFPEIDRNFQLIEQQTVSIFVPVHLPAMIPDESGALVQYFSPSEIDFLSKQTGYLSDLLQIIDGREVWNIYLRIMTNPNQDFIAKKVERKVMQGILAKFTFSIFDNDKFRKAIAEYIDPSQSFESYLYLSHWEQVYDMEAGLMESRFDDPLNGIL